jgi:MFS family permease
MLDPAAASLATLMRHTSFANFWCARVATTTAYQMLWVAIGWQIYDMTGNALDLGLVGLMQFLPVVAMSVVVGQTVDRYDRRAIARTCECVHALAAAALAIGSAMGWLTREGIFGVVLVTSTARAFEMPSIIALLPGLVAPQLLPRAVAASNTASQTAVICGPALGGIIYGIGPTTVYALCAATFLLATILVSMLKMAPPPKARAPVTLATMFAGFSYVSRTPVLLGAISLDLFVVLLGGITALLPIFARDILDTGPWGLGLLRSAPAVGALGMSAFLVRHSLDNGVGRKLFASTAMFGIAIVAFSLSASLAVSIAALVV